MDDKTKPEGVTDSLCDPEKRIVMYAKRSYQFARSTEELRDHMALLAAKHNGGYPTRSPEDHIRILQGVAHRVLGHSRYRRELDNYLKDLGRPEPFVYGLRYPDWLRGEEPWAHLVYALLSMLHGARTKWADCALIGDFRPEPVSPEDEDINDSGGRITHSLKLRQKEKANV